jgi:small-conductance mechanosensitive channel
MNEDLLLAVFVAVEGVHSFSAFMPSAFTIRTFVRDREDIAQLRAGYIPAVLFVFLIAGLVGAIRKKTGMYLAVAMMVTAFMVALYEFSIRARASQLEPQAQAVIE